MAKENSNDPNIKYQNLLKEELKNEIKAKLKPKRYQFLYFVIIFSLLFVLPGYLVNTYGYDSFEVYLFWLVIYLIFLIIHAFSYLFCMLTLAIVYFRTKYRSYLYEFTLYLTSLTIPALGLFHFHPGSEVAIYAFVMIIIISAGPLLGQSLINKPIIVFNSKYPGNYIKTDLLLKKTINIQEFEDGFSPRPFFLPISYNEFNFENVSAFRKQLRNYAKFLIKNGELLDFEETDKKVIFYLRTSISTKGRWFYNTWYYLKKFISVYKKKDLTSISILFTEDNTSELSMYVNQDNYNKLQDVTYHLLVEGILNDFKESMFCFFASDYFHAFIKINPYPGSLYYDEDPIEQKSARIKRAIAIFALTTYLFAMISYFLLLILVIQSNHTVEEIILGSLIWPAVYYVFIFNIPNFHLQLLEIVLVTIIAPMMSILSFFYTKYNYAKFIEKQENNPLWWLKNTNNDGF